MSIPDEIYSEGRSSIRENVESYVSSHMRTPRTTAVIETRRFFVLFIGVLACIGSSTSYVYNLFSGSLQSSFNLSQNQMSTITTGSALIGLALFPLAGMYDYYGPKPLFFVALTLFPLGSTMFGFTFAGKVQGSVLRFTVYNGLMGIGAAMFDISGLMTLLSIFPSSRGAVIAIMKTFIGLGSAIFGSIALGFFEDSKTGIFYFMAVFVSVVAFLCLVFIELPPYKMTTWEETHLPPTVKQNRLSTKRAYFEQIPPMRRFGVGFILVFILFIFLPTQSILSANWELSGTTKKVFAIVTVCLVMGLVTMALPVRWLDGGSEDMMERAPTLEDPLMESDGTVSREAVQRMSTRLSLRIASTRGSMVEQAVFHMPLQEDEVTSPQYQTTFLQSIRTFDLWAIVYALFCSAGTQMVLIVNARFIYSAIKGQPITNEVNTLLTVSNGVGSALGRVLMSVFEMYTQSKSVRERTPLTVALFIPCVFSCLAALLILVSPKETIVVPFALAALSNGLTAASVVLVMRSIYAKDPANHYNCMSIGSIASSLVLNKLLYGKWYSKQAKDGSLCYGRECVFVPFCIMTALCCSSLVAVRFVHQRYKRFCEEHFRQIDARNQGRAENDAIHESASLLVSK